MDEPITDAELIAGSLSDPDRFGLIFERHYQSIFRYLVRRLGRDLGARLASEVFVRAFEGRHRFRPDRDSARPWLFGIAHNLVRMQARKHRRGQTALLRLAIDRPEDGGVMFERIDQRVDAGALSDRLHAGLIRLKAAERETLLLYALGELTYREVAEAMGVPVGTVRSRLARTRATLRELLGDVGQNTLWDNGA